jgi:intein/homing endonuclease
MFGEKSEQEKYSAPKQKAKIAAAESRGEEAPKTYERTKEKRAYGVRRGAGGLHVWSVKLLSKRKVAGELRVFDLQVEGADEQEASFLANGVVVHNSCGHE